MDGERFDAMLRRAMGNSSRRGILRIGVGALTASALGFAALSEYDDVIAKRKKHKKKKKKTTAMHRGPTQYLRRRLLRHGLPAVL